MNALLNAMQLVRKNLALLLAMLVIVVLSIVYGWFVASTIAPGLEQRNLLASELSDAEKASRARPGRFESADNLKARLDQVQATLAAARSALLTDEQARQSIEAIYEYAATSQVTIVELKLEQPVATPSLPPPTAQPKATSRPTASPIRTGTPAATTPTKKVPSAPPTVATPTAPSPLAPAKEAYRVYRSRLVARGDSRRLVDFIARMQVAAQPGFVISNMNLTTDQGISTLSLDITIFTVPDSRNGQ